MLVDATSEYLIRQIDAGASVVQIFDSWSAAIPEPFFHKWIIEPTREIVARVRAKHSETPIIGFPRLSGAILEEYVLKTKVDGVSLDTGVPLEWARDNVQKHVCVQGNIDPHLVVAGGDTMRTEATRILDTLSGGAHIFNLGHGFVPETPPENVGELSNLIKNYRR
jgi:uroporphyrinogen decarboxylase